MFACLDCGGIKIRLQGDQTASIHRSIHPSIHTCIFQIKWGSKSKIDSRHLQFFWCPLVTHFSAPKAWKFKLQPLFPLNPYSSHIDTPPSGRVARRPTSKLITTVVVELKRCSHHGGKPISKSQFHFCNENKGSLLRTLYFSKFSSWIRTTSWQLFPNEGTTPIRHMFVVLWCKCHQTNKESLIIITCVRMLEDSNLFSLPCFWGDVRTYFCVQPCYKGLVMRLWSKCSKNKSVSSNLFQRDEMSHLQLLHL